TLAAAPRRPLLLAAKAGVFGAMALAVGEAAAFLAFFAGGAAFRHGLSAPALSQPGVLRAVLLGGASYCLIGPIIGAAAHALAAYLPIFIIGNSLTTTTPERCTGTGPCPHFLSAWAGL